MSKKSRTRNSMMNFTAGMANQTLQIILKVICRTVFVATLGKSFLGINGIFSDVLSMLSLTELGLAPAINFKLYKPLAENDKERIQVLMKFYRTAYRVIGLAILIIGLCLIPFLPALIKDYDRCAVLGINPVIIYLLFLGKSVMSYWFFAYRSAILKADQKRFLTEISDMISVVVINVVQIVLLLLGCSFLTYTIVAIAGIFIRNLIDFIFAEKGYHYAFVKTDKSMDKAEIKDMFKDVGALFVNKFNAVAIKATDNLVLSAFIGLDIVGVYSNYLLLFHNIKEVISKMYKATHASMGNLFTSADDKKKIEFFETMNFVSIILYGTAAVGMFVCADELLTVWLGEEYVLPQPFSMLIGIEILFSGIKANLNQIRTVSGLFRQKWMRPVLGIFINVVSSIMLVFPLGIYGVILGTIMADVFANFCVDPSIIYKYAFNGEKKVGGYYLTNFLYFGILAVTGLADWLICTHVFVGHGWYSLFVHIIITGLSVPLVYSVIFGRTRRYKYLLGIVKSLFKRKSGSKK